MRSGGAVFSFAVLACSAVASPLHHFKREALVKRQDQQCTDTFQRATVYTGNNPSPDTADAFLNFPEFASKASADYTITDFTRTFVNEHKSMVPDFSAGDPSGTTLAAYDPAACADICKAQTDCKGFTLFYTRLPKTDTSDAASSCTLPEESLTNVFCQPFTYQWPSADYLDSDAGHSSPGYNWHGFNSVIAGSTAWVYSPTCDPSNVYTASTKYTGETPSSDTPSAFASFSEFSQQANNAATPAGYTRNFVNQNALAAGNIVGASQLATYDVNTCAETCSANSMCKAFNVFYSRIAKQQETVIGDIYCQLPDESLTQVTCLLFGAAITGTSGDAGRVSGSTRNGQVGMYAGSSAWSAISAGSSGGSSSGGSSGQPQCGNEFTRSTPYTGASPSTDTPEAFLNFAGFASAATAASDPTNFVHTFTNKQVTVNNVNYGDPTPTMLSSYDPAACAATCDNSKGCKGFGMWFQRMPKTDTTETESSCSLPSESVTVIYCQTYFNLWPTADNANSDRAISGFTRNGYTSVISGSNAYVWSGTCDPSTTSTATTKYTGPTPSPDTSAAFLSFSEFSQEATNAVAPTGYTRGFINQNAMADGTIVGVDELASYDVGACAKLCSANSVCKAFNVLYYRTPKVTENFADYWCQLPDTSVTKVYCFQFYTPITRTSSDPERMSGSTRNGQVYDYAGSSAYNVDPNAKGGSSSSSSSSRSASSTSSSSRSSSRSSSTTSSRASGTTSSKASSTTSSRSSSNTSRSSSSTTSSKSSSTTSKSASSTSSVSKTSTRSSGTTSTRPSTTSKTSTTISKTTTSSRPTTTTRSTTTTKTTTKTTTTTSKAPSPTPKVPTTISGFQTPHKLSLGRCFFKPPSKAGAYETFIKSTTATANDLSICGTQCLSVTSQNAAAARRSGSKTYQSCNYIVAAYIYSAGKPTGQVRCDFYTKDRSGLEGNSQYEVCGTNDSYYRGTATYLINGYSTASRTEIPK